MHNRPAPLHVLGVRAPARGLPDFVARERVPKSLNAAVSESVSADRESLQRKLQVARLLGYKSAHRVCYRGLAG
jgi:hypothetical protein